MTSEHLALLGLSVTLLGTLVVSTWRFSSLASSLAMTVKALEEKEREQDSKLSRLDDVPVLKQRIEFLERNHSQIPKLAGDIEVLKTQAQHSREMRRVLSRSRPSIDPDEDGSD